MPAPEHHQAALNHNTSQYITCQLVTTRRQLCCADLATYGPALGRRAMATMMFLLVVIAAGQSVMTGRRCVMDGVAWLSMECCREQASKARSRSKW